MGSLRRLAVLDDYQQVAEGYAEWQVLRARGVEVVFFHEPLGTGDEVVDALRDFDAVAAMRERTVFDAKVLTGLSSSLRLLVTTGMNNSSIDLDAAARSGVTVCGTAGSQAGAPELTWALLLAALRFLPAEQENLRGGRWQRTVGREAEGLTLGVVGPGKIGSRIARYAHAFGLPVLAWSPHLTPERADAVGAEYVGSLTDLCGRADVVSLHLRLSAPTHHIVGEEQLRAIGPAGLLVNTARSGLVDTAAMLRGLHEGWLGGAALDVFDVEPLPGDDPVLTAPRTVLTPHLGYVTEQGYARFYSETLDDVLAYLDGAPLRVLT